MNGSRSVARKATVVAARVKRWASESPDGKCCVSVDDLGIVLHRSDEGTTYRRLIGIYDEDCDAEWIMEDLKWAEVAT